MERQITIEQVIDAATQGLKNSLYHRIPGSVVAYHTDSLTADIQPMTNDPRTEVETGAVVTEPWPVIKNVPIAWPRFGGFVLVGPLKVGDPVTLEAFDLDPTTAFAAGAKSSTTPVDPGDVRRHGGGYWSATPTNLTKAIADASAAASAFLLGLDGDTAQIIFSLAQLAVGKTGSMVAIAGGAFPLVVAPWATGMAAGVGPAGTAIAAAAKSMNGAATAMAAGVTSAAIITGDAGSALKVGCQSLATAANALASAATALAAAVTALPPPATVATTAT